MKRSSQRGFSLVELIIAIALGALIISLVFYAVTQGQKNSRDDARKAAANRYLLAAKQWTSENNGAVLGTIPIAGVTSGQVDAQNVVDSYITANSGNFKAPDSQDWTITFSAGMPPGPPPPGPAVIYVFSPGICNAGAIQDQSSPLLNGRDSRKIAVAVALEAGSSYCVSN